MTLHLPLRALLPLLAATALAACAHEPAPAASTASAAAAPAQAAGDADATRARAAAMAFSTRLRERLQGAMQAGGPVAAIGVCHDDAPRIAADVMATHDVRLGRVAVPGRNRNPGHVAADWQRAPLDAFARAVADSAPAGEQVAVIRDGLPDGVALRMMRGIATEPGCLACHGSHLAPDVQAALAARYPDDAATGFSVGDLRGALWVEVPAAAR
ncbi:DUF3365 domain-containing protein [uncultured Luteimonas sp.]|uniref:Tll0287-like domain-containing protein n=1 Tax=uncultured Luteimonas sp. TaxID=453144 RepID=UPI00261BB080|nr:DUF3365 domain-containing protein [uncultured Luteimonas sp.]